MNKNILLSMFALALPVMVNAQSDDVYFTPTKKSIEENKQLRKMLKESEETYYIGSDRDVDEYNRRGRAWEHYQQMGVNSKGQRIMSVKKGNGIYPDSVYLDTTFVEANMPMKYKDDDYKYTRRVRRFSGYYDPWYDDDFYYDYSFYSRSWGWRSPWSVSWYGYYNPYYYGYAGWYDPFFYDRYAFGYPYGWYSPYRYYGWGGYYGWGNIGVAVNHGHTGSLRYYDRSNYANGTRCRNYSNDSYYSNSSYRSYTPSNIQFRNNSGSFNTPQRNNSFGGGSSWGGTRSSGSFGGGSSIGGGARMSSGTTGGYRVEGRR